MEETGGMQPVRLLGVELIGVNQETGLKLLLTAGVIALVWIAVRLLRLAIRRLLGGRSDVRARFWSHNAVSLCGAAVLIVLLVSIWFDDPRRLALPVGLVTAGLAVALQRVITAFAGYFVILSGRIFSEGDRIAMGGVRGDVIALGFTRTRIMEMGQPPTVQEQTDEPAMWIGARQYTGRVVTVTNDKVFDEPIYNFTREFPFVWEEIRIPIRYGSDRARAEAVMLESARRHGTEIAAQGAHALQRVGRRYFLEETELGPRVYLRLTDNWIELALRFLVRDHGIRELKDAISRDILAGFEAAGIDVASATFELTRAGEIHVAASLESHRE